MHRDFKADLENKMYKNKDAISSMIPYEYEGVHYALDLNAGPLLRSYILSAVIAYHERDNKILFEDILATRNLDDVSDDKSTSSHEQVRNFIIEDSYMTSQIAKNYHEWDNNIHDDELSKTTEQLFTLAMTRLYTSFKAAVILLNNGFFLEVNPVFRMILEQLGWAAYLLQEKNIDNIKKNRVQHNINHLKTLLNDKRLGELYGYLSGKSHLEPSEINSYAAVNNDNQTVMIRDRSGKISEEITVILFSLLESYAKIVWLGLKHFGFRNVERQYFEDWYNCHLLLIKYLRKILQGTPFFDIFTRI
ncbi:MAG: hypothetical protein IJT21_10460 [Synergistaceae bacterium]|nr:hypothetical protein [Synergistaceae bacterium]